MRPERAAGLSTEGEATSHRNPSRESRWSILFGFRRLLRSPSTISPVPTITVDAPAHSGPDSETPPLTKSFEQHTAIRSKGKEAAHPRPGGQLDLEGVDAQVPESDISFIISRPIRFTRKPRLYYFPLAKGLITPECWRDFTDAKEVIMQNFDKDYDLCGKVAAVDLVMTGRGAVDATPTIIVSVPKELQKQGRKIIEQSHVRAQYEPTFTVLCGPFNLAGSEVSKFDILFNPGMPLSGCPVIRQTTREHVSTVTCGLWIDDQLYALTAGHPFNRLGRFWGLNNKELGDSGDELKSSDEMSSEESSDDDAPQAENRTDWYRGIATSCSLSRTSDLPERGVSIPHLDWALIELDPLSLGQKSSSATRCTFAGYRPPEPRQIRRVNIMMPFSDPKPGFILPHRATICNWDGRGQSSELWTVTLLDVRDARTGLSGALVVDDETSHAYGHVVATNLLNDLYICPLDKVIDQISDAFASSDVKVWNHVLGSAPSDAVNGAGPPLQTRAEPTVDSPASSKNQRHLSVVLPRIFSRLSPSFSQPSRTWIGEPENSIGELAFQVPQTISTIMYYWDVAGPAEIAWKDLGPEIGQELHQHGAELASVGGEMCQYRMYMVGESKKLSEPTLMFFSDNDAAENYCRDVVRKSHILDRYPGLRLAKVDDSVRARLSGLSLLATTEMECVWKNDSLLFTGLEQAVLSPPRSQAFGRRLFIPTPGGQSIRPATGGAIVRIGNQSLQLTVGHVFRQASGVQPTTVPIDVSSNNHNPQENDIRITSMPLPQLHLSQVGKLSMLPYDDAGIALDYALIELHDPYRHGVNLLPIAAGVSSRTAVATDFDDIPPRATKVVTMTASTGHLDGSLSGTPSYVRLPGTNVFQALYPVQLNGPLSQGDCGSTIVNQRNGKVYGHIVCGIPGTGSAYIMPATAIVQDITRRLREGYRMLLSGFGDGPRCKATTFPLASLASYGEGNRQQLEFASKRFLEQQNPGLAIKSKQLRQKTPTLTSNQLVADQRQSTATRLARDPLGWLPREIFSQIVGNLLALEILRLRLVSRSWDAVVTDQGKLIARHCVATGRIPRLVLHLHPAGASISGELDIRYMVESEQRVYQADSLSGLIAERLAQDMFLQKSPRQRREFEHARLLMQRRISALLLILSHFLENYCHGLLREFQPPFHGTTHSDQGLANLRDSVEQRIMAQYTSEALLEAHQFFPVLLSFLERLLRPPSYLSPVEKAIAGRLAKPIPSTKVHVAILCIGGLPFLLKLAKIERLGSRLEFTHDWYSQISQDCDILNGRFSPILRSADTAARSPMNPLSLVQSSLLLQTLPSSTQKLWLLSAQRLLLERKVFTCAQDFRTSSQVLGGLISSKTRHIDSFMDGIRVLQP